MEGIDSTSVKQVEESVVTIKEEKDDEGNIMLINQEEGVIGESKGNETTLQTQPLITKKQLRKEEKQRLWEAAKARRKEHRHKKKQEQKERRRQHLEQLRLEAIKEGIDPSTVSCPITRKKLKSNSMKNSSLKLGICIDMSFSDLMMDNDLHKCIKQLSRCYSANRRFENPVQLYITSFPGKSKEVIEKYDGWQNWDVNYHEKSYLELDEYPKDKIVYLTAESENVLTQPEHDKLYVIGGLVDHNSKKGLCHELAVKNGVQHARLPLGEYIEMNRRKVLSILHVFEIVGRVAQNKPWAEVLMDVLPPRSEARLKNHSSDDEESSNEEENDALETNKNVQIKEENVGTMSQ